MTPLTKNTNYDSQQHKATKQQASHPITILFLGNFHFNPPNLELISEANYQSITAGNKFLRLSS